MPRSYYCEVCKYKKQTDSIRGPVPRKCPECKTASVELDRKKAIAIRKPDRRGIEAQEKVQRALELRRDYWTWDRIARELGYSSKESAYSAAKVEMLKRTEMLNETIDEFRNRELERLEHLADTALKIMETEHLVINAGTVVADPRTGEWFRDNGPKLAAIDRLVKIGESARKLLGADAPAKVEAAVTVNFTVTGIPESEMP